jgi:hypothetical protein
MEIGARCAELGEFLENGAPPVNAKTHKIFPSKQ